jgi:hypothetical protein
MPVDGNGKFQLSGLRKGSDGKLPSGKLAPRAPKVESPEVKMHEGDEGGEKKATVHIHGDGSSTVEHHNTGDEHDLDNIEQLKDHLSQFFDEEAGEHEDGGIDGAKENKSHPQMGSMGGDVM